MQVWWQRWGRIVRAAATAGTLTVALGVAIGAQAATTSVSCVLGATPSCQGVSVVGAHQGDSLFSSGTVGGKSVDIFQKNTTPPGTSPASFLYFQLEPTSGLLSSNPSSLYLTVEYYDQTQSGTCSTTTPCYVNYSYDSSIASAPVNGAYAGTAQQDLGGTSTWKTVTWKLTQVSFNQQENNNADFRLGGTVGLAVHKVVLSLQPPTTAATTASTSSSNTSNSGSSASTAVPQTGGSPFVPLIGVLLLIGGVGLVVPRIRSSKP